MLGNFSCHLLTFFPIFFPINSFKNTIRVPNGLDLDQDRCSVGPDLGPNFLQRLPAEAKVAASKESSLTFTTNGISFSSVSVDIL